MNVGRTTPLVRVLARRGLGAALLVVDAGLHPRRTARRGARLVQDVAAFVGATSAPDPTPTDVPVRGRDASAPATASTPPQATPVAPTIPATPPPPVAEPEPVEEPFDDSLPVEPQGPAPHMPPDVAAEVERDYSDDVPGFAGGEPSEPDTLAP